MKKTYHHGDLRKKLMETGLEIIEQEGEEALSLRKVAIACGVSNAAPYAHFKDKDAFIEAISDDIMQSFCVTLEGTIEKEKNNASLLPLLGKAYVLFFYQHPLYYRFLFSRKNIKVQLSLEEVDTGNNPPFEILKKTALQTFGKMNMPKQLIENKVLAMWALVHGLAAIVVMPNVDETIDWEVRIEEIIKSIAISSPQL